MQLNQSDGKQKAEKFKCNVVNSLLINLHFVIQQVNSTIRN